MNLSEIFKASLNERLYNIFFYYYLHIRNKKFPKKLLFDKPKTFNEKTIWLKMNYQYENANILADKVLVKDFVKNVIGEKYIIPTIALYDNVEQIDFTILPNSFVLKANHGSGWNIICNDKTKLNIRLTIKKLNKWMKTNYYKIGKEYQYENITPKIICETYLENSVKNPLFDYKIFCFSGKPKYIQVDLDRFTNHSRNFYDLTWKLMPFTTLYPLGKKVLPKPELLDEMVYIASRLSRGMIFARIDLYFYNGNIFFGEITFHHGGGFEPFIPSQYDYILGQHIALPV